MERGGGCCEAVDHVSSRGRSVVPIIATSDGQSLLSTLPQAAQNVLPMPSASALVCVGHFLFPIITIAFVSQSHVRVGRGGRYKLLTGSLVFHALAGTLLTARRSSFLPSLKNVLLHESWVTVRTESQCKRIANLCDQLRSHEYSAFVVSLCLPPSFPSLPSFNNTICTELLRSDPSQPQGKRSGFL